MSSEGAKRLLTEAEADEVLRALRSQAFVVECLSGDFRVENRGGPLCVVSASGESIVSAMVSVVESEDAIEYVVRSKKGDAKVVFRLRRQGEATLIEVMVEGWDRAREVAELMGAKLLECLSKRFASAPLKLKFSWTGVIENAASDLVSSCVPISSTRVTLRGLSLEAFIMLLTALAPSPSDVIVVVAESPDVLSFFGFKPSERTIYDAKTVVKGSSEVKCFKGLEALKALLDYGNQVTLTVCRLDPRAWGSAVETPRGPGEGGKGAGALIEGSARESSKVAEEFRS